MFTMACALRARRTLQLPKYCQSYASASGHDQRQRDLMARGLPKKRALPGVQDVILVASGKGGVGKSTTAVNLALSLATKFQKKAGILDADIYGPSIPIMMNLLNQQPELCDDGKTMLPLNNYGVKCMSMGFLIKDPKSALVWRGPMAMGAVEKLCFGTDWNSTDVLIVDMPPGTGDIHLSIAQTLQVKGAVIVSTPQKVALADGRKAVSMFSAVKIPVIGLVENMGAFSCPKCGEETSIFGEGGVVQLAKDLDVPFLGSIPLEPEVMRTTDEGTPIAVAAPDSKTSQIYAKIAEKLVSFPSEKIPSN